VKNNQVKGQSNTGGIGMKAISGAASNILTLMLIGAFVLSGVVNLNGCVQVAFRLLGAVYKATEITIQALQPEYRTLDEVQRSNQPLPSDDRR
jgi:hypothetical protein